MTNVVDIRIHLNHQSAKSADGGRAAVVAELVALSSGIREEVEKTAELSGPSALQIEQTVQHLVDALHQLESAIEVLTENGHWEPF